jgi:hypothetical protein
MLFKRMEHKMHGVIHEDNGDDGHRANKTDLILEQPEKCYICSKANFLSFCSSFLTEEILMSY